MPDPNAHLDALSPKLAAIAAADVQEPSMPVATFIQQGKTLAAFLAKNPDVVAKLRDVSLPVATLASLPAALDAVSAAEAQWGATSARKAPDLSATEAEAATARSDIVAALRWNLRQNPLVQGAVDAVQEGNGVPDLVQDLHTLAALIQANADAFASDHTFDPVTASGRALALATKLASGTSDAKSDASRRQAVDLRNRAFTYAHALIDEVREAGRYAFRGDATTLAYFKDEYTARARARARRRALKDAAAQDA